MYCFIFYFRLRHTQCERGYFQLCVLRGRGVWRLGGGEDNTMQGITEPRQPHVRHLKANTFLWRLKCIYLYWVHTRQRSGLTPGSVLGNHTPGSDPWTECVARNRSSVGYVEGLQRTIPLVSQYLRVFNSGRLTHLKEWKTPTCDCERIPDFLDDFSMRITKRITGWSVRRQDGTKQNGTSILGSSTSKIGLKSRETATKSTSGINCRTKTASKSSMICIRKNPTWPWKMLC